MVEITRHKDLNSSTCNPSPSSTFLASVISGILSAIDKGYPSVFMTLGLQSKSHMFPRNLCMPGGTHALKILG